MSRMLYFIQVPWDWVKQRPHFLAEELSSVHDITVVYNRPYTRRGLVRNPRPAGLRFKEPCLLPFDYLSKANSFLATRQLKGLLAESEIVWLTHPFQFAQIGGALSRGHKVVYDCMDDNLAFAFVKKDRVLHARLFDAERQMVERSDLVVASSDRLRRELARRYGAHEKIQVVNNGIALESAGPASGVEGSGGAGGVRQVSYIGTIAEWFDFGLVLESLSRHDNIVYNLYGPQRAPIPHHERLRYRGQVEHRVVFDVMRRSDALVMPFLLDDLVQSVNPVKVYEYIYAHRPAIVVGYGETAPFADFVHLYHSAEQYHEYLARVADGTLTAKKSERDCVEYAESNTWKERGARITALLEAASR